MASISGINIRFFRDLLDWRIGRINRSDYICLLLPVAFIEDAVEFFQLNLILDIILFSLFGLFLTSILIKRLHDCGASGWWSLLCHLIYYVVLMLIHGEFIEGALQLFVVAPLVFVGLLLVLCPGQKYENKYGKPYKDSAMFIYRTQ